MDIFYGFVVVVVDVVVDVIRFCESLWNLRESPDTCLIKEEQSRPVPQQWPAQHSQTSHRLKALLSQSQCPRGGHWLEWSGPAGCSRPENITMSRIQHVVAPTIVLEFSGWQSVPPYQRHSSSTARIREVTEGDLLIYWSNLTKDSIQLEKDYFAGCRTNAIFSCS